MRIFVAVQVFNWEQNIIDGLVQAGHEIVHYDWKAKGHNQYDKYWDYSEEPMTNTLAMNGKERMNDELLKTFYTEHKHKPFDLFFGYLSDPVITREALDVIKSSGIYMINYSCNNQMSFNRTHSRIGNMFDCNLYPEKNAGIKFNAINAKSLLFPYGVNPIHAGSYNNLTSREIGISFVGQPYGYRADMMLELGMYGISINLASQISLDYMKEIYARSILVAGFRGLNDATIENQMAKQLRGRDFETPAMGGAYLTEYMEELEDYYEIGKEILTFKTRDEFIQMAHEYTKPSMKVEVDKIREAGMKRVLNEYTWKQRFDTAFIALGLI